MLVNCNILCDLLEQHYSSCINAIVNVCIFVVAVLPDVTDKKLYVSCNKGINKNFTDFLTQSEMLEEKQNQKLTLSENSTETIENVNTTTLVVPTNTTEIITTSTLPTTTPQDLSWARHIISVSGCFGRLLSISCEHGQTIRILTDIYGRGGSTCAYKEGDCIVENSPEHSPVNRLCGGRGQCGNLIVNRVFCEGQVSTYQYVEFQCVPGETRG